MGEAVERRRAVATPALNERIATGSVGEVLVSHRRTVECRKILAYAAAVGADDELFLDDAREGGIVAVPGYVSSLDWPLLLDDRYLRAIKTSRFSVLGSDGIPVLTHGFAVLGQRGGALPPLSAL